MKINQYNENGEYHGYWEQYYHNGNLWYKGSFINGRRHGLWEYYHDNGKLMYKGNYLNGKPDGYWEWYNGNLYKKTYLI